jgi:hypothetical protein
MRTRTIGFAIAGVFGLVSCMQDSNPPVSPTAPQLARGRNVGSCAITTTVNDAKAYFSDSKDPVFALLDTLTTQSAISASAATPVGFRVLSRLGAVANTAYGSSSSAKGDSVAGSKFANDVLGCMSVAGYDAASPVSFVSAFGKTGLFGVRSDAKLQAVISRATDTDGEPLFGAESGETDGWHASLGGTAYSDDILFYGSRLPLAATFEGEDTASVTFELSTLPTPLAFTKSVTVNNESVTEGTLRAGVCDMSSLSAQILHDHDQPTILPQAGEPSFCNTTGRDALLLLGAKLSPTARVALAARSVANYFLPQPLMARIGGGSALVSGLSDLGAVTFDVDTNTAVTFYTQPASGKLNANPQFKDPIAVQVLSTNGTALGDVKVSLTVVGNSGSFTPPADSVRFTGADGIATFPDFQLDKAGGYTITAHTPSYGSAVSNLFNLTGKLK